MAKGGKGKKPAIELSATSLSQGRNRSDYKPLSSTQRKVINTAVMTAIPAGRALKAGAQVAKMVAKKPASRRFAKEFAEKSDARLERILGKPRPGETVIPGGRGGKAGPNLPVRNLKPKSSGKSPRSLSATDKNKLREISDIKDYAIPPKPKPRGGVGARKRKR
jgi:hypothetical protein